jgi:hypothetical protein
LLGLRSVARWGSVHTEEVHFLGVD